MRRLVRFLLLQATCCATFRFEAAHPDCWRRGSLEDCCQRQGCWDDFWTFERCCLEEVNLQEVPDNLCLGGKAQSAEDLRLERPSKAQPFVFLWDEKCGGTTFNEWLLAAAHEAGQIDRTHISDYAWPNVIGSPFFLKTYSAEKLHSLEIVSANVDWNIFPVLGCDAPSRQPHCFILLRNPIDRFISYYLERSDRRLEGGSTIMRFLEHVPLEDFEAYLQSIRFDRLRFSGEESGLFCNRENGELCFVREGDVSSEPGPESDGFRSHGGPQNRLARMLDPPYGRIEVAKARLARCVVSLQNEDFANHLLILRAFYPWLKQVKFAEGQGAQNIYNTQESVFLRDNLPARYREAIARFNAVDMELYQFGLDRFYWQVAEARKMLLLMPPSYVHMPVITLPTRDWEVNWPFFKEQLPTAFLMRRLSRCRITHMVSQCGKLVGERLPEGVDYKLPATFAEQLARLAGDTYYAQGAERFYQLGFADMLREAGYTEATPYQEIRIPEFQELLDESWEEMQDTLATEGLPQPGR